VRVRFHQSGKGRLDETLVPVELDEVHYRRLEDNGLIQLEILLSGK